MRTVSAEKVPSLKNCRLVRGAVYSADVIIFIYAKKHPPNRRVLSVYLFTIHYTTIYILHSIASFVFCRLVCRVYNPFIFSLQNVAEFMPNRVYNGYNERRQAEQKRRTKK